MDFLFGQKQPEERMFLRTDDEKGELNLLFKFGIL